MVNPQNLGCEYNGLLIKAQLSNIPRLVGWAELAKPNNQPIAKNNLK